MYQIRKKKGISKGTQNTQNKISKRNIILSFLPCTTLYIPLSGLVIPIIYNSYILVNGLMFSFFSPFFFFFFLSSFLRKPFFATLFTRLFYI
ncbi:hypothetical protein V8B55DRAFT_1165749 [Mucor lusitanicus]